MQLGKLMQPGVSAVYATALLLLAGCGGASNAGDSLPGSTLSQGPAIAADARREAEFDAMHRLVPASAPSSADRLYISNPGNNSITIYHHDAQGDARPIALIVGTRTRLHNPGSLTEDAAGNLYVADDLDTTQSGSPAVIVFAHGANGNVAPIRILSGPATGIKYDIGGIIINQSNGKLFVSATNIPYNGGDALWMRFPPNASGNMAPFAMANSFFWSRQFAFDSSGQYLIDAHVLHCCLIPDNLGVDEAYAQFTSSGLYSADSVTGVDTFGVADDPITKTYLVSAVNSILRFAEGTNGAFGTPNLKPALVSSITNTPVCGQLALGYLRNIYAVCNINGTGTPPEIRVYTHDSTGNAIPLRILSGPNTGLNNPYGIYEGK